VRSQFQPLDPAICRAKLFGNAPSNCPVLLVMGGSQGASGINDLIVRSLPLLAKAMPQLRVIHLAGPNDAEKIRQACAALKLDAVVHSFFAEMELALGAATVAVSRAGASSLAELAAMRVPAVLVPFPFAADNHQFHNARAFEETGAARLLEQKTATPEALTALVTDLIANASAHAAMQAALAKWHAPGAAGQIAEEILRKADCPVPADQFKQPVGEHHHPPPGATDRHSYSAV
jgi:UDP-N-acetylglucosamine--N-acetylmuramyl-(pentapeptide) pyrophosphoryl-undecaprenol N-acetylglucosamine transferase